MTQPIIKKIELEELKEIQLSILDKIHEFCMENNIHYTLACGTMLGCARHKGYIPWDDDIDIYLLRPDYDKLMTLFPKIYKDNIKIISLERDNKWNRSYAKAYDTRTVFKEFADYNIPIGVNIDIFPIDKVPENNNKWEKYNKKRRFLINLHALKTIKFRKDRTKYKNCILLISKFLLSPFSSRYLAKTIQNFCIKYNKTDSNVVFECALGMLQSKPFNINIIKDMILMPFEDREYMAMKRFDEYLTAAYGDWRKLPPVEKRITHHFFEAYWEE